MYVIYMLSYVHQALLSLNNSKFFGGIIMLVLNIFSKYVTVKLSKTQEQFLQNTIARQLLIFAMAWMGTRDIYIAITLTAAFFILTQYLFNEESSFCIIPKHLRVINDLIDTNDDNKISPKEIRDAIEVLEKAKRQKQKQQQLEFLNYLH
jgi:hypothetical protein